ncbi:PREDICTED: uncharacterized protein YMR317W-like isoform X2 [Brassica oleracea var. oleracea]|uniref:uncharacterized protein YMR317W-like isoform X2 n=1 Tax=Brassica oleracea var. oleracea TaxID=109376 RepID=UPI0006A6E128|nr:PREDICTED: uncharacterized protein YMR317W-like isoform X2 [Brassica oleracea var. oleracea]
MARISLALCLMLVVTSSVIYEARGHFLLKDYLTTKFPSKSSEFTPYVNTGLTEFLTDLERFCPPTPEFKSFFTEFKSFFSSIETSSSTSQNIDMEKKGDGLFKAVSAITGGAGQKSAEAGSFKSTMISMAKTLVEQKKSTTAITSTEKKTLVTSMVQWTKTIATTVKTACEKKGKKIDINSFGLNVDVNSVMTVSESRQSSSSSSKSSSESSSKSSSYAARAETAASAKAKETTGARAEKGEKKGEKKAEKKGEKKAEKKAEKNEQKAATSSAKTKEATSTKAGPSASTKTGTTFRDTTGGYAGSPRGSPTAAKDKTAGSPRGSPTAAKEKTSVKGTGKAAASVNQQSNAGSSRGSAASTNQESASSKSSSTTSVTEIEKETSQETTSFISGLEKRFAQKAELKPFFEKLKASMTASSRVSSTKSEQEYTNTAKSTTGKLSDAMSFVGSRFSKSAEMKSNIQTTQQQLIKNLQQFQNLNSQIVGEQKVSSTKETEIKKTMSKIEQVTTQFVETAASSSSSSSKQETAASQQSQKKTMASSKKETAASSQQQTQQQTQQENGMGRLKTN